MEQKWLDCKETGATSRINSTEPHEISEKSDW